MHNLHNESSFEADEQTIRNKLLIEELLPMLTQIAVLSGYKIVGALVPALDQNNQYNAVGIEWDGTKYVASSELKL